MICDCHWSRTNICKGKHEDWPIQEVWIGGWQKPKSQGSSQVYPTISHGKPKRQSRIQMVPIADSQLAKLLTHSHVVQEAMVIR